MAKTTNNNSTGRINQIVEGSVIEGNIVSNSNFRIDGKIIGKVNITGKLVLGPKGLIEGEIVSENAEIEGTFKGNITVNSFLSLKSTAKIDGDIFTQKIAVEPGAIFTGKCIMGGKSNSFKNSNAKKEEALN